MIEIRAGLFTIRVENGDILTINVFGENEEVGVPEALRDIKKISDELTEKNFLHHSYERKVGKDFTIDAISIPLIKV